MLANLGNSSSSNNISSKSSRQRKRYGREAKYESDDTDENELQLGLGGLFLGSSMDPPMVQKTKRLGKAPKRSKAFGRRNVRPLAHNRKPLSGPKPASSMAVGGLFGFASQRSNIASTRLRNMKLTKRKSMTKFPLEIDGQNPIRTSVTSGYDAEKEDKPSTANQRSQRRVATNGRKHQQAPGLFHLFSVNDNAAEKQQNDDMDWLCSRLDQHCSIGQGCKKRSAAPTHTLDSLCKRIDQKSTPAKLETTGCLLTNQGHEDIADDDASTHGGLASDEQEATEDILQQSMELPRCGDAVSDDKSNAREDTSKTSRNGNQNHVENRCNGACLQRRQLLDPPGYAFRASSAIKSDHYNGSRESMSARNKPDPSIADRASTKKGIDMATSAEEILNNSVEESCPEKDHGCVYMNQDMNSVQMSPITLASPLLNLEMTEDQSSDSSDNVNTSKSRIFDHSAYDGQVASKRHGESTLREIDCSASAQDNHRQENAGSSVAQTKCTGTDGEGSTMANRTQDVVHKGAEGVLRRSQRPRKVTDRLSIELGGNYRIKQQGCRARLTRGNPARLRNGDSTTAKAVKLEERVGSPGKAQPTRRSKRATVPTAFFHNGIQAHERESKFVSTQGVACGNGSTEEDDFLDDSSTESDDTHTENTPSIGLKSKTASNDYFSSSSDEPNNSNKPRRFLKIENRTIPALKKSFLRGDDTNDWTGLQISQLHHAYNQCDPTSPAFWQDVSLFVQSKSASECQAKWFSLAKTPGPKGRTTSQRTNHEEDDIFDATPVRFKNFPLPSKLLQERMRQNTTHGVQSKPSTNSQEIQDETTKSPVHNCRKGFKTYLQDMRRDVNRAEKAKKKRIHKKKPVRQIADQDYHVNMKAKLTPGGTLDFQHDEDIDEWDKDIDEGDEGEIDE